jgi:hypothetical protein
MCSAQFYVLCMLWACESGEHALVSEVSLRILHQKTSTSSETLFQGVVRLLGTIHNRVQMSHGIISHCYSNLLCLIL